MVPANVTSLLPTDRGQGIVSKAPREQVHVGPVHEPGSRSSPAYERRTGA